MALVLYDSNILIDAPKGYRPALDELTYSSEPAISTITSIEEDFRDRPSCKIRIPYGVTSANPVDFIDIHPPQGPGSR